MKTKKFYITLGVSQGYKDQIIEEELVPEYYQVRKLLQELQENIFQEKGILVSFVTNLSSVVYKKEFGCHLSGEATITLSGVCNTKFSAIEEWKEAVVAFTKLVKKEFGQHTLTLEFVDAEIIYYE